MAESDPTPLFRIAELEDLASIVDIYNSTIPSRMITADTSPVSLESKLEWFHAHNENWPLWVIFQDNKILGWLSFEHFYNRPAYDQTAEISLYLDSAARGKGIGKKALHFAEAEAKRLGFHTLLGLIFEHNTPSQELFLKTGYTVWGDLPKIAVLDGQRKSLKILGKTFY